MYEWPFSGIEATEEATQLPVMNWAAGPAQSVATALTKEWKEQYSSKVNEHFNSEVIAVDSDGAADGVTLRWRFKTKDDEEERKERFAIVIFAVGFGLEPKGINRNSYWENDALDKTLAMTNAF